jgi:uncharacterized protein YbjT (DUF2867 family)
MIAVVGGRGAIGATIVAALRDAGHAVVVATHDRDQARFPGFRWGDLLCVESLRPALRGAEVVIQAANFATYPVEKRRQRHTFLEFDGRGTERLVAAARGVGARRYIYLSSAGVRADSRAPFHVALWRGEKAVLDSRLEAVCLRPTRVYGSRARGLGRLLTLARRWPVVPVVGDGQQRQQPVWVGDLAEVVRQAVAPTAAQGVFEVGGPDVVTYDDMLRILFRTAGLRRRIVHVPRRVARLAGRVLAHLPGSPLTPVAVDFFAQESVADLEPLLSAFEIEMTPFATGLEMYFNPERARRTAARPPPGRHSESLGVAR